MTEHEASRTLVKSSPELWAECSDPALLGRHLDHFGEIRITRLEPETAVAWEGACASGTVRLEPSGWGTRVVLTVRAESEEPAAEESPRSQPAPALETPVPLPPVPEPPPQPKPDSPEPEPEPMPLPPAAGPIGEAPAAPVGRGMLARLRAFMWPPVLQPEPEAQPVVVVEVEVEVEPEPEPEAARTIARGPEPPMAPSIAGPSEPAPNAEPRLKRLTPAPTPPAQPAARSGHPPGGAGPPHPYEAALSAALQSLGQAHHRPFSRP